MLATERGQISLDFQEKVKNSKTRLNETVDDFLKSLIDLMEKVKIKLEKRISLYNENFEEFYDQFITHVEDFLIQSIKFIKKSSNVEEIQKIYSENGGIIDQVLERENEPLSSEVDMIKKKRKHGRELEHLLLKIQQVYENFNLKSMRDTLDMKLSNKNIPLNSDVLKLILDNANVDITNMMMVEGRFENEGIIPKFSNIDEYEKLRKNIQNKLEEIGIGIGDNDEIIGVKHKNLKPRIGDYIKGGKLEEKLTEERSKLKNRIKNLKKMSTPLKKLQKEKKNIINGIPSLARISDNKLEINLHFDPIKSKIQSKKVIHIAEKEEITSIRALDSRNLVIGAKSGILRIVDLIDNDHCLKRSVNLNTQINYILPHPFNNLALLIGLGSNNTKDDAGYLREIYLDDEKKAIFFKFEGSDSPVFAMSIGPKIKNDKQTILFSGCLNGEVIVNSVAERQIISSFSLHNGKINDISFINSLNLLLTGGNDAIFNVFRFNKENLSLSHLINSKENSEITKIKTFDKDESICAICLNSGLIKLWNLQEKQ